MKTQQAGFTLVELMVVLVLLALGSSLVVANMRSSLSSTLDTEAQRLQAVLENARAQARSRHTLLTWTADAQGFTLSPADNAHVVLQRMQWLAAGTLSEPAILWISAEPLQAPARLTLRHADIPAGRWVLETDGVRGFTWKP